MKELVTFTLHILKEKSLGHGEDMHVCETRNSNAAFIACMDGCGGSGSTKYSRYGGWTGARIASHLAGISIKTWFEEKILTEKLGIKASAECTAANLEQYLRNCFLQAADLIEEESDLVSSSLLRVFPTTLAIVLMEPIHKNRCRIRSFWAGDSRTYYFPVTGLQQTSTDNIHGNMDPFDELFRDGIMNNVVCASEPFRIFSSEVIAKEPCMVLTATDGCFSYFPSPMYLEWALLESLQHVKSPAEWERDLRMLFGRVAGDDYTMELAVIGFRNFTALQKAYAPRWDYFHEHFAQHLQPILERGDEGAHRELWMKYKKGYMPRN